MSAQDWECTPSQLEAYFNRIGLFASPRDEQPSLQQLKTLQWAHISSIPYENLTLVVPKVHNTADTPLTSALSLERIVDKLVFRRSRGGYCFEHNQLFAAVLASLGYELYTSAVHVVNWSALLLGDAYVPLKGFSHQIIIVTIDRKQYLVDVGFTPEAPRQPLELRHLSTNPFPKSPECSGASHRIRRGVMCSAEVPEADNDQPASGWYLQVFTEQLFWKDLYFFTETAFLPQDYDIINFWIVNSPQSIFNKGPIITLQTEIGRKTLNGTRLHIFWRSDLVVDKLISENDFEEVLEHEFGILL